MLSNGREPAEIVLFLFSANLDDILIGQRFVRLVVLGVLEQHFVHVGRRVLVQSVGAAEDDESDLAIAQHRQLVRLFHHAKFALIERHLDWLRTKIDEMISNEFS